jgi:hypothetical protein
MPADNVDIPSLLEELVHHRFITGFTHCYSTYGAIRNFCRFQRPKKPKTRGLLPDGLRAFVGIPEGKPVEDQFPTSGEPVRNQFPTGSPPKQLEGPSSVPVGNQGHLNGAQYGTGGEKSPQMEEGGGRRKDEETDKPASNLVVLTAAAQTHQSGSSWKPDPNAKPPANLPDLERKWAADDPWGDLARDLIFSIEFESATRSARRRWLDRDWWSANSRNRRI